LSSAGHACISASSFQPGKSPQSAGTQRAGPRVIASVDGRKGVQPAKTIAVASSAVHDRHLDKG
jgi:hypothetical protein